MRRRLDEETARGRILFCSWILFWNIFFTKKLQMQIMVNKKTRKYQNIEVL